MATYLFVTKPEYTPERVAAGFDVPWWSCSSTTECGDSALVYVSGAGIQYEWRVTSDAVPHKEWKYICDVEHMRTFDPAITIREIRDVVPELEWKPPYQNFRGFRSIRIPERVTGLIQGLRPSQFPGGDEGYLPEEVTDDSRLIEGAVRRVSVNAYERNPEARRRCIKHHGTSCSICQFDFCAVYGEVVDGYIHIHHLRPLSEISEEYVVDPVEDLRPVCPNCHAVIHSRIPAYSIQEVRSFLRRKHRRTTG